MTSYSLVEKLLRYGVSFLFSFLIYWQLVKIVWSQCTASQTDG